MEILLATDLSARCDRAFDRAVRLARLWNAHLTIASAIEPTSEQLIGPSFDPAGADATADGEVRGVVREIRHEADQAEVAADVIVRRGSSADVLVNILRERHYDLVVTGIARRMGFLRSVVGGTVDALLKEGIAPVLMVKDRVRADYRSAVAGVDFSAGSRAALICTSALFPKLRPIVLHTFRPGYKGIATGPADHHAMLQSARADCEQFIDEVVPGWSGQLLCIPQVGDPGEELCRQARRAASELIIVGSNERGTIAEFLFGSTGRELISGAPCDLMMVPSNWQLREPTGTFTS
jgi:nucleotide-binding universal stress UspA family protein